MPTVFIDYTGREEVAATVIGGMTVAERVLREAADRGARRAIVRGRLPSLPSLPIEVVTGDVPTDGASVIAGDVVAGVQITDEATRQAATHALFESCRRPYDGLGDRHVIRAISLRLTRLLCLTGITPNQVTTANVMVGLLACYFAAAGHWRGFAIAGALLFAQVVLDSCDGELARIRHMRSRFGMWLDNTSDDVIDNVFIACVGIGAGGHWKTLALVAALLRGFVALWIHVSVALRGKPGDVLAFRWWFDRDDSLTESFAPAERSAFDVLRAIGRRDLYCLIYAAGCALDVPALAILVASANAIVHAALLVAHIYATRASAPARSKV